MFALQQPRRQCGHTAEHLILCIDDVPPAACALALPTTVRMKKGILRAESRPGRVPILHGQDQQPQTPTVRILAATVKVTEGSTVMLPAVLQPINRHDSYLFHLFLSVPACFWLGCLFEPRPGVGGSLPVFCNEGNVFRKPKNVVGLGHWFERRQGSRDQGRGQRIPRRGVWSRARPGGFDR